MPHTNLPEIYPFAIHSVVNSTAYEADLEEYRDHHDNQMLLMHITMKAFSPSVLKRLRADWQTLRATTNAPLFAIEPQPGDFKWARFVEALGFVPAEPLSCPEGTKRLFVSVS